eukprot:8328-Heterococcus_DN1.PRE.1
MLTSLQSGNFRSAAALKHLHGDHSTCPCFEELKRFRLYSNTIVSCFLHVCLFVVHNRPASHEISGMCDRNCRLHGVSAARGPSMVNVVLRRGSLRNRQLHFGDAHDTHVAAAASKHIVTGHVTVSLWKDNVYGGFSCRHLLHTHTYTLRRCAMHEQGAASYCCCRDIMQANSHIYA